MVHQGQCLSANMRVRSLAEGLFYLSLSVLALKFCKENIYDYMGGKTQYCEIQREPLTLIDLPTLALCLPPAEFIYPPEYKQTGYILGENINILAKLHEKDEKTVQLQINESVTTLYGLAIQTNLVQQTLHRKLPCFKISTNWNGSGRVNLRNFGIQLKFTFNTTFDVEQKFKESKKIHKSLNAYFTSGENAYGIAWGRWFDGDQGHKSLINGKAVRILEATEYQNLESACTSESYYECLARRLFNFDLENIDKQKLINGSVCPTAMLTNVICSTIPLPRVGSFEIPMCETDTQKACFEEILQKLRSSQETECKRSCTVLEFEIGTYMPHILGEKKSNEFTTGYLFDKSRWVRGLRSETVQKIIRKEYLINSFISLVGTIGGTLGMFVGLSIMGVTQWLQDFVLPPFWKWIKNLHEKVKAKDPVGFDLNGDP